MEFNLQKINTLANINSIKEEILALFKEKSVWYRKPLINEVIARCNLPLHEKENRAYNSNFTKVKSLIGTVVTYMLNEDYLVLTPDKELHLRKDIPVILKEEDVVAYIGKILAAKPLKRVDIIKSAVEYYQTDKTKTKDDDAELVKLIDAILKKGLKRNTLTRNSNKEYVLAVKNFLNRNLYDIVEKEGSLPLSLQRALAIKGGEFFEAFSVKLLATYYQNKGCKIVTAKVTGGALDNGIDGVVTVKDDITETRFVLQAKVRSKANIKLKEVREFYGAFKANGADIGIFITNSHFNQDALRFKKNLTDLCLIDAQLLYKLAVATNVGIVKMKLDREMFLEEN